jgi:hypothetical protein
VYCILSVKIPLHQTATLWGLPLIVYHRTFAFTR